MIARATKLVPKSRISVPSGVTLLRSYLLPTLMSPGHSRLCIGLFASSISDSGYVWGDYIANAKYTAIW